ncbi:peptidase S41 [Clostridia bacterium]|nr:peptidase S41 [Clostridia bacterium]
MGKKILHGVKVTILTISVVVSALTGILTTYYFFKEPAFVNLIRAFHDRKDEISSDLSEPEFVDFMLNFRDIKYKISRDYLGEVPPDSELYLGAYQGMVRALGDPWANVWSKKQNKEIGMIVPRKEMFGIVGYIYVFVDNAHLGNFSCRFGHIGAGSQLEKAGFKTGDIIVGVNSFIVESEATKAELEDPKITKLTQDPNDINYLLAGLGDVFLITAETEQVVWSDSLLQMLDKVRLITPEQKRESQNKNVLLKVLRHNTKTGTRERFSASVAKVTGYISSAHHFIFEDDDIGYIRLRDFNLGAGNVFAAELNKVLRRGVKGLIIDLRFNPGGIVEECNKIIGMFIKKGEIYKCVGKKFTSPAFISKDISKTDIPVVVLVNEKSMSCSELFAAVMQAHGRGTIIGTQTFGKGVIQDIYPFACDEMTLWLTTREWVAMPGNVSINKVGVTPDLEVPGPYLNSPAFGNSEHDPQLSAAIKYLKENNKNKPD